ncbi:hypothetical protein BpHYR1_000842 [Brachionus plicatilis]|uniref:Uncharacterized protein n=1 Tax=Brachionus plicatilis TaxID=10195 RepID=A0A3M7RBH9_BRAPC|nr:hypothetical protein BpHYR1_000842 [Brachionus plicatilis]
MSFINNRKASSTTNIFKFKCYIFRSRRVCFLFLKKQVEASTIFEYRSTLTSLNLELFFIHERIADVSSTTSISNDLKEIDAVLSQLISRRLNENHSCTSSKQFLKMAIKSLNFNVRKYNTNNICKKVDKRTFHSNYIFPIFVGIILPAIKCQCFGSSIDHWYCPDPLVKPSIIFLDQFEYFCECNCYNSKVFFKVDGYSNMNLITFNSLNAHFGSICWYNKTTQCFDAYVDCQINSSYKIEHFDYQTKN